MSAIFIPDQNARFNQSFNHPREAIFLLILEASDDVPEAHGGGRARDILHDPLSQSTPLIQLLSAADQENLFAMTC